MAVYKIKLLGSPAVSMDGIEISLSRQKSIALLAYLAVTGRRVSRSELASLFWPEIGHSNGLAALRTVFAEIKSALGSQIVSITRDLIYLIEENVTCDVIRFREALSSSSSTAELKATETLWGGSFLHGFELPRCIQFEDWRYLEEQNLQKEYKRLLKRISVNLRSENLFEEALLYSRKSLPLDAYDEETHREIMSLYAALGNRDAALRQYKICEKLLEGELGFPPDEETQALAGQIKKGTDYTIAKKSGIGAPAPSLPRIVVLPFHVHNSIQKEHLDFSNIAGEVLTDVFSSNSGLEVISRTSALTYRDSAKTTSRIAAELGADYIVEGFIDIQQDKMVLESRLIHAFRDAVLSINKEILEKVPEALVVSGTVMAAAMVGTLGLSQNDKAVSVVNDPGKPWKLHAKHLLRDWNLNDIDQAIDLYKRAVKINPADAEAWAGLAFAFLTRGGAGLSGQNMEIIYQEAEAAVTKALSLDPSQATALWIRGQISAEREWDYKSAERYFLKALEYAPESSEIFAAYSQVLIPQGRPKEALAMAERACEIDPVNSWNLSAKYWSLIALASYRKADELLDTIDSFFPKPLYNRYSHGFTQLFLGNFNKAITIIEPIKDDIAAQNMHPFLGMLAFAYASAGRADDARLLINDLCREKESCIGFHMPIAAAYGALGELDTAVIWLERAAEARDPGLFFLAATPFYKPLYKDPRFIMLLDRVNIKPKE